MIIDNTRSLFRALRSSTKKYELKSIQCEAPLVQSTLIFSAPETLYFLKTGFIL
jgi:hypothetical protein